jgi:crotonobetainyl-CoA:carnitine CoA-transferase CaiB-like acyl-CoA transferase
MVGGWIAERDFEEVVRAFEEAEAAVAPIYDIRHIVEDPQYRALDSITTVEDDELGPLRMQNVIYRLSETPGSVRWAGRRIGQDNAEVYGSLLGLDEERLAELREKGAL